ncbi:hypothetical protein BDQ17DRAFT_1257471 [Cyathus striatus]|nr:hypothetical protein BDQ17DRAFT_1257471 [Cyathus striatus]
MFSFISLKTYSFVYFLHFIAVTTMAILTNVTVDDSGIDPITGQWIIYSNGVWNQGPCPSCAAQPDKAHMYNMTWHDGSVRVSNATGPVIATFSFNGSAIYIFCAIALVKYWGISNMTFSIDGEVVGSYERNIDGTAYEYEYNVLVYSNTTLSPRPHQFTLQNGDFGYSGSMSFTIFDYLIYS